MCSWTAQLGHTGGTRWVRGLKEAAVATEYRRRRGDETKPWHFCANCKSWPKEHYETSQLAPTHICDGCKGLERRQMCTKAETFV